MRHHGLHDGAVVDGDEHEGGEVVEDVGEQYEGTSIHTLNKDVTLAFALELCRVSFYTGTGNEVLRLVTNLTDFFEENKDFLLIL